MSFTDHINLGNKDSSLLIFGGPYSNLPATSALLAEARHRQIAVENIICTGDIVAYAAEPEQCCQLIRQAAIHTVLGNCEESIANELADCGCGFSDGMLCSTLSAGWYRYAQSRVTAATRDWMKGLPGVIRFSMNGCGCVVTHGSFSTINQFIFASTDQALKQQELLLAEADILIGGHSGLPFGERINDRLWLNAGVIGLPANDATVDGWYMLMEPQSKGIKISWHRLQYDYRQCYQSMLSAGVSSYADCIISGLWPSMDVLPQQEQAQRGTHLQPDNIVFKKY